MVGGGDGISSPRGFGELLLAMPVGQARIRRMTARTEWIALFLISALFTLPAAAQKIFRWTDEKGVVHFGHSPPNNTAAEEQKLPPPRPTAKVPTASTSDTTEASDKEDTVNESANGKAMPEAAVPSAGKVARGKAKSLPPQRAQATGRSIPKRAAATGGTNARAAKAPVRNQ